VLDSSIQDSIQNSTSALKSFFEQFSFQVSHVRTWDKEFPDFYRCFLYIVDEDERPFYRIFLAIDEKTFVSFAQFIMEIPAEEIKNAENDIKDMFNEILNIFSGHSIRDLTEEKIFLLTSPEPIANNEFTRAVHGEQVRKILSIEYRIKKEKSEFPLFFRIQKA